MQIIKAEDILQDKEVIGNSANRTNWKSVLSLTTCLYCAKKHGKIIDVSQIDNQPEPPSHGNCKCKYVPMRTKIIGTATKMGPNGADVFLSFYSKLPEYYVTKKEAEKSGWKKWKGNLAEVLPNKMIGGDIYKNRNGKLPQALRRVWREADINYTDGYRNNDRILYSNDGLIFITYDHYHTFYELTY